MEANQKEVCDFIVPYHGENWHIYECWKNIGTICGYIGETRRYVQAGTQAWFHRTFAPDEIEVPKQSDPKILKKDLRGFEQAIRDLKGKRLKIEVTE